MVVILSLQNPAVVRFARKRQEGQQQGEWAAVRCHARGARGQSNVLLLGPSAAGDAAAAAEGTHSHEQAGQLVASVACMPRSLLIFK